MATRKQMKHIEQLTGIELTDQELQFVIEYSKDFNFRRAAIVAGYSADYGHKVRDKPNVQAAVTRILANRLKASDISAEWLLMELVDNHMLARQADNLTASNTALGHIAKHKFVDANAADKVQLVDGKEILAKLARGRDRVRKAKGNENEVSFH